MGIRTTDLQINLSPTLKPVINSGVTPTEKPVISAEANSASVFETQIGQTILRSNLSEILDNLDSFKAKIKHSIEDAKLLTGNFKYSNTYESRLREYSGRQYSNIANRIDNSSSLKTDLFMAALWEQRQQPELKEKLVDAGIKISDLEKYLEQKLSMCIDERWLQGRNDYIKAFLDDKSGVKIVNELLLERNSDKSWLSYSAADHYFISESREVLGPGVHKSFDQTQKVIELLLKHNAVSDKNKYKFLQTLTNSFVEKALYGDFLYNCDSKEYLQQQRNFRDHMIAEVRQNNLNIQGLPVDFIKTLNSENFLSKFIYLKKEDDQLKFSDPGRISEYSLVMLKSQEEHLRPEIREAVNSLISSEDFLNSRAASSYLYAALQLGNDKLINEFIEKLELKHLEKNELAPYHIAWSLLEANLTQENTEKILNFAKSDQIVNNHEHYCNGVTFAEALFRDIVSIKSVAKDVHETKGLEYAQIFFKALDPQKISGAEVASTAAWHDHWNKGSEVKSSLEALVPVLDKSNLSPAAVTDFILQVLKNDYVKVLEEGNLNQIFALNQSIQSLNMTDNFPDFKVEIGEYITHSKPELKVSLEDISSNDGGRVISDNWDFSFLDKVINCFDKESPAVTLLETQRKHAESMKKSLEQMDTEGLKINQAEGLQDTHQNNEVLQVLGEAFLQADRLVPHKYLPALYLMDKTNPEFTQRIEELYNQSNTVRKAGFIARLHELACDEKHYTKIEALETKLIQDCKNSDDLNLMLISLNQETSFTYSTRFIETLNKKIKEDGFIWNINEEQRIDFQEKLRMPQQQSLNQEIKDKLKLVLEAHEHKLNKPSLLDELEASLIRECKDSHDLNTVIQTLNESPDFRYSASFRENLLTKIYRDETFIWNANDSEITKFKKSLPPLFNKLLMDRLPTIEGLKIENLSTCPAKLESQTTENGETTLQMMRGGKQIQIATITKNEEQESYTLKNREAQDEIQVSVLGKWGYQGCDYFTPGDYFSLDKQLFYCNQNKETAQLEFIEVTEENINLLRSLTKNENNLLSLSEALAYSQGELIRDEDNKIIDFGGGLKNGGLLNHSRFHKLHEKVYFEDFEAAVANNDVKTIVNLSNLIDKKGFNLSIDKLNSLVNEFMNNTGINTPKYEVSYAEIQATTREARMYPNEDIKFLDKQLEILKKYPYFDTLSTRLSEGLENLKEVYQAIQEFHNNSSSKISNLDPESRNNALELFGNFLFHMDDANTNYVLPLLELPNLKAEFQERLDERFTAAMLPTKAAYVARMQKVDLLEAKSEHPSSQYLNRETEMLKSCVSSEMLLDLLVELKDNKFIMNSSFQRNLLNRVAEDDFKWNMNESSQRYFLEKLKAGEIIEHPPVLVSYLSGAAENPEMIISQYIDGEQRDIGTIKKNENGFSLTINESASDLAFGINGITKNSDENEIAFQPKDFLRIDKKLYYIAKNNVHDKYELLEVSNKAALMEDLFFSHGEISISQKSLPECMHLAGIIAALNDENGTLIKGIMQGLSPDIDSQGRTIYSFRFPAEVKHDPKIAGLNTQRIFLKRDAEHGLREVNGSLIPTEIDYEPEGNRDDTKRYIREHSAGVPGVAFISYAFTELVRRTDNLYSILGKGENRVHIEPKMPVREVGRLLGMEESYASQVSKNAWRAGIEYSEGGSVTINSSFSQDLSVNDEEFIGILQSSLENPYHKMTAGSRHKTQEEALKDSGKATYEDCTWDEQNVFKKEENGHKIIDHHAVAVSLTENGDFLIHCPHNSLMPVKLSPSEFLDFYDQVNIFKINERRTFMENPLP